MTTTRERVMQTLLSRQRCTINDLADELDMNPISVRHHIAKLEAEDLIKSEEVRHGVGRPRREYFLTEEGMEKFPTRYLQLTMRLLTQLKESLPEATVKELFSEMAKDLAEDYAERLDTEGLSLEERLDLVADMLNKEGFSVNWFHQGDQYIIRETGCPYYRIGQTHPEVCCVDQTLISTLLEIPAHKIKCILDGDEQCTYVVDDLIMPESVDDSRSH